MAEVKERLAAELKGRLDMESQIAEFVDSNAELLEKSRELDVNPYQEGAVCKVRCV